jgi:DNA-binding beta-propeller fold protein YncE
VAVALGIVLAVALSGGASASLGFESQFGSQGTGNGQFESPFGVAVDPGTGDVYVTDLGSNRVEKFDSNGDYLAQFGSTGSGPGQFLDPIDVTVDGATGDVDVVDGSSNGNHRVEKFDANGNFLAQFGSYGSGCPGQFQDPFGIAVDPRNGDVYVSDEGLLRVEKFDSSGNFLSQFGSFGVGPGQFFPPNGPAGLAVDPHTGDLYVTDFDNYRVQTFDPNGNFLGQIGGGCCQFTPSMVAVEPATGSLYVSDPNNNMVDIFNSSGSLLGQFGGFGTGPGQFDGPVGTAVDPRTGEVYVVDLLNDRVEKFGGVAALLQNLGSAVTGTGSGTSLSAKVTAIAGYVAVNDTTDACGALRAFVAEVRAQSGKKIPAPQAASDIAQALEIETALGC